MVNHRILFIDDEETAREIAAYNLRKAGFKVDLATSAEEALALFTPELHPLVITDLRLPGKDGMAVLKAVKKQSSDVAVVVITAFGDVETAVEAMRAGAYDFIAKPFNRDQLRITVSRAMERAALLADNRRLLLSRKSIERPILHTSDSMKQCLAIVDRVASTSSTILLSGESGTGKELVARRLHARSKRTNQAFVAINCAAIPSELIESELFGHEKGTFTGAHTQRKGRFQLADKGTLFLDEIAELPLALQGKLLRALQEGQIDPLGADTHISVDVRVIAASNQNLRLLVEEGKFREDLFYRLNVVEISLPPLRKRLEDIPLLTQTFVAIAAQGRDLLIPKQIMETLLHYDWPGNVRELQNACERLAILCPGDTLRVDDLPPSLACKPKFPTQGSSKWLEHLPEELTLFDVERMVITHTLHRVKWNLSAAARSLGVPRHILAYRVEKFGIRKDD